ncbi:MAG: hypothetical protein KJ645_00090, partial [Planctomycetes bacterium]|nr:hypothetical protein [Planctomycetota bacterium]
MAASILNGTHGRILEIDLSAGSIETKPLEAKTAEAYLGGRGLATRLFVDTVNPKCDPLGPDNVLVLATSPLLGTNAQSARHGVDAMHTASALGIIDLQFVTFHPHTTGGAEIDDVLLDIELAERVADTTGIVLVLTGNIFLHFGLVDPDIVTPGPDKGEI